MRETCQESAGVNVGCMAGNSELEFPPTYNSSQGNTQMDYVMFDLGIVTNVGMYKRSNLITKIIIN